MKKLVLIALASTLIACGKSYSNGSRVGTVNKLSQKGLIWKSWEGEMLMGGVRQKDNYDSKGNFTGSTTVANVFTFNVDPAVVPQVQESLRSGRRVELVYRQWALSPPTIDNDHVVVEVKPAD